MPVCKAVIRKVLSINYIDFSSVSIQGVYVFDTARQTDGGRGWLLGTQVPDRVAGEGPERQETYNGKCDDQNKQLCQEESSCADGDAVGKIIEPVVGQPPAEGQGETGCYDGEPDELAGYEFQDTPLTCAEYLPDSYLFNSSFNGKDGQADQA